VVAATGVVFAPQGGRVAHAIGPRRLRYGFALTLCVVGVKMLAG